jgi:hypothetical protein
MHNAGLRNTAKSKFLMQKKSSGNSIDAAGLSQKDTRQQRQLR